MGKTTTDIQLVPIGKLVPYANNARTFPDEVYGTMKFKKKRSLRWRNIKKAYKLMGCNKIAALLKILKDHFVEDTDKDSHVIYEWPSNIGKSDSMPGKIVGITR